MNSELSNLQQLVTMPPRTASGRVGVAWAVIRANLAAGKTLREVWEAAERDGLDVPYSMFKIYVQRLRKRDLRCGLTSVSSHSPASVAAQQLEPKRNASEKLDRGSPGPSDPLRNVREQRAKKNSFDYHPFPARGLTQ
jgi:hypothetical protein